MSPRLRPAQWRVLNALAAADRPLSLRDVATGQECPRHALVELYAETLIDTRVGSTPVSLTDVKTTQKVDVALTPSGAALQRRDTHNAIVLAVAGGPQRVHRVLVAADADESQLRRTAAKGLITGWDETVGDVELTMFSRLPGALLLRATVKGRQHVPREVAR